MRKLKVPCLKGHVKGGSKKWKPRAACIKYSSLPLPEALRGSQELGLLLEAVVLPSPRYLGVASWEYAQQAALWNAFNLMPAAWIITALYYC